MITNPTISLQDLVVQETGNILSDMDGEKVMLSIQNGKYYNLGVIGGAIWDLMKEPISVDGVIASLMTEYEVERTSCEEQVLSFLEHLMKEGIIGVKV